MDLESCLQLVLGAGFVGSPGFVCSAEDSDSDSCEVVPKKSKTLGMTGKKPRPQRATFAPTAAGTVHTQAMYKVVVESDDNGSAEMCGMHSAGSLACLAYIH